MLDWPVVDIIQFARQSCTVVRTIPVKVCPRLTEILPDEHGAIRVQLEGILDTDSKPCLHLRVDGSVSVTCQRCLESLQLQIDSTRKFILAQSEDELGELAEEADDVETLFASNQFNVLELVEDEVLLQIPIAPIHEEGQCERPHWAESGNSVNSAFAVLGTLANRKP